MGYPDAPCMEYLPTFALKISKNHPNVGKYTSTMEHLGYDIFVRICPDVPTIRNLFFSGIFLIIFSGFRKIPQDQVNNGAGSGIFHGKYLDVLSRFLVRRWGIHDFSMEVYGWENHDILWWLVGYTIPDLLMIFVSKSTRNGEFSGEVPQIPSLKQRRFSWFKRALKMGDFTKKGQFLVDGIAM